MELSVAKQVGKSKADFIIPARIDDLPYADTNIQLQRLNSVDFSSNWMTGLGRLLEKLETDAVPKDERFNPSSVAQWWRDQMKCQAGLRVGKEQCASNWFKVGDLPSNLYLHSLEGGHQSKEKELPIGIPNYRYKAGIFCFEPPNHFEKRVADHRLNVTASQTINLCNFQRFGYPHLKIEKPEARNIFTYLVRRAFEMLCLNSGLSEYSLSGDARCFWFQDNFAEGDKIEYIHLDGRKTYRRMVGFKTLQPREGVPRHRTWHFAIQPKVIRFPELSIAIKSHVVFSEAGTIYESKARQHSARRGQCKLWHNDTWLDRMLAAMAFLSDPASRLFVTVPCGTDAEFTVQTAPMLFESPVTCQPAELPITPDSVEEDEETVGDLEEDDSDIGEASL